MRDMSTALLLSAVVSFAFGAPKVRAKGLDTLEQSNPDNKPEADKDDATTPSTTDDQTDQAEPAAGETADKTTATAAEPPSATSKALAGKLSLATSFGWVKATQSTGDWQSGGMSDVTVGYRVAALSPSLAVDATYRYAPVAVSGVVQTHSYRGVWETHYVGARANYTIHKGLNALGTAELGFTTDHLKAVDELGDETKYEKKGAMVALGGGADWQLLDSAALALGPRLYVGLGAWKTVQLGVAAGFLF